MAIRITDFPNTDAPDSDFPYGNVRNNTGSNDGTPVDKETMADMYQFFARMMTKANEVDSTFNYNGLPDNAYSGFQFFEALGLAINGAWQTPSYAGNFIADGTTPIKFRLLGSKRVRVRGKSNSSIPAGITGDELVWTIPAGIYRPALKSTHVVACVGGPPSYAEVNTNGQVRLRGDLINVASNDNVWFEFDYDLD
jgi:hypothetical protein